MSELQPDHETDKEQRPENWDDLTEPMSRWSRLLAIVFGLAAGGAGGYAVFVSSNQAGTAVLLAAATAFLLVGVQGTPLLKFGSGDNSVQLARIRRRAADVIKVAARDERPEVAEAVMEAVQAITSDTNVNPAVTSLFYEQRLTEALRRIFPDSELIYQNRAGDMGIDIIVSSPDNRRLGINVKYRRRGPLTMGDVEMAQAQADAAGFEGGLLLITNAALSSGVLKHNGANSPHGRGIEAMTWNDEGDDDLLARAAARNLH